jgi:hypothetical protein
MAFESYVHGLTTQAGPQAPKVLWFRTLGSADNQNEWARPTNR